MLLGILLGLGASICWGLANVAVQRASHTVGTFRGLLWSQLLGAVMAAIAAAALDHRTAQPALADVAWVAVAGASALLAYLCLFYAFEHGRLTLAVPIMSSWSVIAAGLSLMMFDHRLTAPQLLGGAVVIAGALLVSRYAQRGGGSGGGAGSRGWLVASIGAAIGFGVLIPAMARLVPAFGSSGAVAVSYLAEVVIGLPLALAFRIRLAPPAGAAVAARAGRRPARDRRVRVRRGRLAGRAGRARLAVRQPRVGADRQLRLGGAARAPGARRPGRRRAGHRRRRRPRAVKDGPGCWSGRADRATRPLPLG